MENSKKDSEQQGLVKMILQKLKNYLNVYLIILQKKKKKKNTKKTEFHSTNRDENLNEASKECELNAISLTITNSLHVEDTVHTHRRKGKLQVSKESNDEKPSQGQKDRKVCFKRYWHAFVEKLIDKHYNTRREAHIIDKLSRGLFPVAFVIFNAAYFITVFFLVWVYSRKGKDTNNKFQKMLALLISNKENINTTWS